MRSPDVSFRAATSTDVPAMVACHSWAAVDPRMAAYFDGKHDPHQALPPRIGYVASVEDAIVGYIAGHLTTRHGCQGEVQYLFVSQAIVGVESERLCLNDSPIGSTNTARAASVSPSLTIARPRQNRSMNTPGHIHSEGSGTGGRISAARETHSAAVNLGHNARKWPSPSRPRADDGELDRFCRSCNTGRYADRCLMPSSKARAPLTARTVHRSGSHPARH